MNYHSNEAITIGEVKILNCLPEIGINAVQNEIVSGLTSSSKYISSKYFYDDKGSKLFGQITNLDEYYLTRTEKSILSTIIQNLNLDFIHRHIIELGSGDSSKIQILLQQIPSHILSTLTYYPVDISQSAIRKSVGELSEKFPMVRMKGIIADFLHQLNMLPKKEKRLFCFLGSTIGNLDTGERKDFMELLGEEMQKGESLLLGIDMVKDITVLEKAYNDSHKLTADFNKNILMAVNALIDSDFNTEDFEHVAFYNSEKKRIEMHLRAKTELLINTGTQMSKIQIFKGETIHTENSHKFDMDDIKKMGHWSGCTTENIYTDENEWFSVVQYKKS